MLQWFFLNYFSWAYLQLAAHKLMTSLGLSKSDWFGHSCKDQHDVWAGQPPWLTSNQYLLSICEAGIFRRGIVVPCGCIHPKSPSPGKSGQHVETRPLGPSSVKAATFSNPMITCPTCGVFSAFTQSRENKTAFLHQFLLLSSSSGT